MVDKIEAEKLEMVDLEKLDRQHESRKRALAILAVPVLLVWPSVGSDTLTVSITQPPLPLPCVKINAADESCFRPEADHPAHGEGSGELPTLLGIGAPSGIFSNTTNAIFITPLWEPPSENGRAFDIFHGRPDSQMLHVAPVTPSRPFLPLARRGLKS
ncbi:MAG: hypothetical protein ABSA78_00515 [Candidatus Sulfotelmatobacter sp.]|jgi:hypothetical protein